MAECNAVNHNSSVQDKMLVQMPALFQGLAQCLKDPEKKFEDKVSALLNAWSTLASHGTSSSQNSVEDLTRILYRDTLHLVLRGEWKKLPAIQQNHLQVTLRKTAEILKNTPAALELCQHVLRLVQAPWSNPTLEKIMAGETDIEDSEVLEFCLAEKAVLLSIRLDVLCDAKCEDFALKLVSQCRRCLRLEDDKRLIEASTPEQRDHWLDLHLAILYNYKKGNECVPIFNQLKLEDGVELVQRLMDRCSNTASAVGKPRRVWRNIRKVAELANQCLLTRALLFMPPPRECLKALAVQFVNLERKWMGATPQEVTDMLHKLVDNNSEITSAHMYDLCTALAEQFREELNPFCIELNVRALAIDLNDLEKKKHGSDEAAVKDAEVELAQYFSDLALLVEPDVRICREVTLTAFSLHPTTERLYKLTELAARSTSDSSNQLRLSDATAASKVERNLEAVVGEPPPESGGGPGGEGLENCPEQTTALASPAQEAEGLGSVDDGDSGVELSDGANAGSPLTTINTSTETAIFSKEAARSLGVSESVINDLAVVVHSQRWQVLCWKKGWEELESLCQRYVSNQDSMRSITKELRYLKVDYSQFKDRPRPERGEFWGIEKGYENCMLGEEEESETVSAPPPPAASKRKKSTGKQEVKSQLESDDDGELNLTLSERKKMLKKKQKQTISLQTSSDSDSGCSKVSKVSTAKKKILASRSLSTGTLSVKRSARLSDANKKPIARTRRLKSSSSTSSLTRELRDIRPDFSCVDQWPTSPADALPHCNNNNHLAEGSALDEPPCSPMRSITPSDSNHFAPMLSTLNLQPTVVLTRTPVKSSPDKKKEHVSPLSFIRGSGQNAENTPRKMMAEAKKLLMGPRVRLEKLNYPSSHATSLARFKGLDHLEVRPTTTAVHMVQLPNPPLTPTGNGQHGITSNGLLLGGGSSGNNNNGSTSSAVELRGQVSDEAGKASTSSDGAATSASSTTPAQQVELISSTVESPQQPPPSSHSSSVTLISTPSVSIFQVAGRPVSAGGGPGQQQQQQLLQPVAAVSTGSGSFINPPNPRVRHSTPAISRNVARASAGNRGGPRPTRSPSVLNVTTDQQNSNNNITLAQLLAQSPAVNESNPLQNGPPNKPNRSAARSSRRASRGGDSDLPPTVTPIPAGSGDIGIIGITPLPNSESGNNPCRVPLVKYVDLDSVSSPSRPRPGSIGNSTGGSTRRPSQGSNSSSPDPHRYVGTAAASGKSPSLLHSPQSPATHLQAPPSPLSFRKHNSFKNQSPSHPAQCPSPFSRPSSRSQDASPSPSEGQAGSMYPPGLIPIGATSASSATSMEASGGAGRFSGASSPSSGGSSGGNSQSAGLPKFGMAFGKNKGGHFDPIPILSPPSSTTSATVNSGPNLMTTSSGNNGFIENDRRFGVSSSDHYHDNNPPAEEEGLGCKLHSLLEGALNGVISRSPTRGLVGGQQHSQIPPSSHLLGSSSSNNNHDGLLEELREFESVFARVARSTSNSSQVESGGADPWSDLPAHTDDGLSSYHHDHSVPVEEFPAPLSAGAFSGAESMDAVTPGEAVVAERPTSSSRASAEDLLEPAAPPLMQQLLTVASAARQALEEEEKGTNSPSPVATIKQEQIENMEASPVHQGEPQVLPNRVVVQLLQPTAVVVASESVQQPPSSNSTTTTTSTATKTTSTSPRNARTGSAKSGSTAVTSPANLNKSSPTTTAGSAAAAATAAAAAATNKPPQKAHDDEHTVLRVQAILEEYKEQLRNSPDLQNKPAPRRRSNPLPSPSTAPKRRKSGQSKVKLLSQHVTTRPGGVETPVAADGATTPQSGPANVTPQPMDMPDLVDIKVEPVEKVTSTNTQEGTWTPPATVQVVNAPLQLSMVVNRTEALPITSGTVTVTTTTGTLTGMQTTMPMMQQLLVTSGGRQILVPVNISGPGGTIRGVPPSTTRYTLVRHVGPLNQSSFIGLRPTFNTQTFAVRALTATPQAVVTISAPVSETVKTSTADSSPSSTTEVIEQPGTATGQPDASPKAVTAVVTTTSATTTTLRFVPTVTRVNLPVPTGQVGLDTVSTLLGSTTSARPNTPASNSSSRADPAVPSENWNSSGGSRRSSPAALDVARPLTASPIASASIISAVVVPSEAEKLLSSEAEAGVSEFLPCADFMGPGISPSPCFSLSDSPLGSQNSSPVSSPASFPNSSADDDSIGSVPSPDGLLDNEGGHRRNKSSKILQHTGGKPRVVMVRNDHGNMEYRKMSDGETGPNIVQGKNRRPSLSKRLASKRLNAATAAVAAASSGQQTPSPSGAGLGGEKSASLPSSPVPPVVQDLSSIKEDLVNAVNRERKRNSGANSSVVVYKPARRASIVKIGSEETTQSPVPPAMKAETEVNITLKPEVETVESENPVADAEDAYIVRPRRCGRLQKDSLPATVIPPIQHDPDSCPLGPLERGLSPKSKRRSSVRTNTKKNPNCPCCLPEKDTKSTSPRKRTKSETVSSSCTESESAAKRHSLGTPPASSTPTTIGCPASPTSSQPACSKPSGAKKYIQRKR